MMFVATINVPGYLPNDTDPPIFDNARDAWEYLADVRRNEEDYFMESGGYSATVNQLEAIATGTMDEYENYGVNMNGEGVIYADTPGYDGDYDLGLVYSVSEVEG